ncbi:RagB/SusD family nutrient uptake outer membrane protein [uncultured Duncaniella sp.]|uniref:RagB/SusD family nutrient uptake outer membrane protein n=1 Tax=uncultured Duncaniella sp. TaxID=2768039 RepID=UPI00266F2351|nr:RagB/SusD family nutrient uptake outer membrane protein [uncultured Duncaniella sp.]
MKKLILPSLVAIALAVTSCDDKLDIIPKGETTLNTIADLELLLNQEYAFGDGPLSDIGMVCNDGFPAWTDMSELLASSQTLQYAYVKWDESIDRATLTTSDSRYNSLYEAIYYCNVIITKAPEADGSDALRDLIIAEAKVKRAYFHYLLVNIYAKQYDESTAAQLGGVPYVDIVNMEVTKEKNTIAEVYDRILDDCSEDIINVLPDNAVVNRADKAFGNAVRAKVLMQMKRYNEAATYAREALRYNNNLDNRSNIVTTEAWELRWDSRNNYLHIGGGARVSITFTCMSKELAKLFSPDDYVRKYEIGWNGLPTWEDSEVEYGYPEGLIYTSFSDVMFNNYGIRTEDMYYILAETDIRDGRVDDGLSYVDQVQLRRIDGYTPLKGSGLSIAQAMQKMQEAKKVEFFCTYVNFFDCKRWNTETDYRSTITRDLGKYGSFTITPDSPLWVMPFPANATRYNPTLTQNY